MSASSGILRRSIYEGWVYATLVIRRQFVKDHFDDVLEDSEHSQSVRDFLQVLADYGTTDETARLFDLAVAQANIYRKWADPNEDYRVTSFDDFLYKVDKIVSGPPKFYRATVDGHTTIGEPIGVPIYLLFDLISNTSAAYTLLNRKDFNAALKALLNAWGSYLKDEGSDSNKTLNEDGWFSEAGLTLLQSGLGKLTFDQTYKSDSEEDPKYYKTWDSFFTREFREYYKDTDKYVPVRPIPPQPTGSNRPFYLYNPCESTVYRTTADVRLHDTFWLKSQKYSLYDMLGGHSHDDLSSYAKDLEGASILQSFLSPQDFHRWHSPVQGEVLVSGIINGTYYAVLPDEGASESDPDLLPGDPHGAMIRSQAWLSVAATRAVLVIKPEEDSPIDLIAFIAIGMVEVSSCEITFDKRPVPNPTHVEVGDELGTFHFGGSSYAVVVKPKTGHSIVFKDIYNSPVMPGQHRWIHSVVGQIWNEAIL